MMKLILIICAIVPTLAISGEVTDQDLVIIGKRGSTVNKELRFGDQWILKTATDTNELTMSDNSGGSFSPLLTASTAPPGGSSDLITSTPSVTVDQSIVLWDGVGGDSLEQSGVSILDLTDIVGLASLTLSASITMGTGTNTVSLYQNSLGDLICDSKGGGDPVSLCGPSKPPSGFAVCHARLENTNGYGSTGAPSFSDKVYQFATLIDECPDGAVTVDNNGGFLAGDGGTFLINTPGKYVVVCSFSVTNNVNVGVTKNVIADSQGNTVFNSVTTANKVCTAGPGQSDGSTGCMGVITLQAGEILTCHGDGVANEVVQGNSFFYIERIR